MNLYGNPFLPWKGDVLLVVPPFLGIDRPSLGVHILQALAQSKGYKVNIIYANIIFASHIGLENYSFIMEAPMSTLLGERFFSSSTYNDFFSFGYVNKDNVEYHDSFTSDNFLKDNYNKLIDLEKKGKDWLKEISEFISRTEFPIVGLTTTFEQTNASFSIIKRIKKVNSNKTIIIGGANCEGEMSLGIQEINKRHLDNSIDYIFSGESETKFLQFLDAFYSNTLPPKGIINGEILLDMEELANIQYTEYYDQLNFFLPQFFKNNIWLPYESSRGCWWGQKKHCTFCGLNGIGMNFRQKSAKKVIKDLKELLKPNISNNIFMVDNIMPYSYFNDLLPMLSQELPNVNIFYEQKSNLTFQKVKLLKKAGINTIQPGIESLSTNILNLMKKGVSPKQNINLLRFSGMFDISVIWNILFAFPQDIIADYEQMIDIIPLLSHLAPPSGIFHMSIERFSPYFTNPREYGIKNIKPMNAYKSAFPSNINLFYLAYHFIGEYKSDSKDKMETIKKLENEIMIWINKWSSDNEHPLLHITKEKDHLFLLTDTRDNKFKQILLSKEEAQIAIFGNTINNQVLLEWGIKEKLLLKIGKEIIPLSTVDTELYSFLENEISP